MDIRLRPADNFSQDARLDEIYHLCKFWKSELEFSSDELGFLRDLVNKNFSLLIAEEKASYLQQLITKLAHLENVKDALLKKLNDHLLFSEQLINDRSSHDEAEFRAVHKQLDDDINNFMKDFRAVKKELFNITGHVLAHEKLQHLLK